MPKRLKIGDVFAVPLPNGTAGYVQYVADDASMLDSYVIRVFRGVYDLAGPPDIAEVVSLEVAFYAHVFLKVCVMHGFWKNIGNAPVPDRIEVLFRGCWDDGNPDVRVSRRWYVWRINEPFQEIGTLSPTYVKAEIGSVLPPQSIVERMVTGRYTLGQPL